MPDLSLHGSRNLVRLPDGELLYIPSLRLQAFYLFLLILVVWTGILPWFILAAATLPSHVTLIMVLPLLVIILAIRWYIPKYWASLRFWFVGTELISEKGVWHVDRRVVPYSRIREITIRCGIVCRYLGIASLCIVLDDGSTLRLPGGESPEVVRDVLDMEVMEGSKKGEIERQRPKKGTL